MLEFLTSAINEWWGILIVIVLLSIVLFALSALLYKPFFKRFYDVLLSAIGIIVLSPVLIILIVVGAVKMKGNPFFTQPRPGKNNKVFKLIKFRTMTNEKDENGDLLPDEKRLNKYGKKLRSTSLDELPEIFNIFLGTMSIVGPRPQLVRDMTFMSDEVKVRHKVRPGLTGLAQVMGRNNITWEEKFEFDLEYVNKVSLFSDVKIIFLTALKVIKKSDIVREGTASDIDYGDWLLQKGDVTKEEYDKKQQEAKELISKA